MALLEGPSRNLSTVFRFGSHAIGLLALVLSVPALGADGRIPVYQVTTITQPGAYYLTQDFNAGGSTAITIQSSNVTLDLNGHTITGTGYMIYGNGYTNIRVTNGTLSGGLYGCYLTCTNGRFIVDHLTVAGTSTYGISVAGAFGSQGMAIVEDNLIMGVTGGTGIAGTYLSGARFSRNVVRGSTGSYPTGNGLLLSSCVGCAVDGNTLVLDQTTGIEISGGLANSVTHDTISGTTSGSSYGLWLTGSTGSNTVDWNTISGGAGIGLVIDSGCNNNEYSYNRWRGNAVGTYSDSGSNTNGGGNL